MNKLELDDMRDHTDQIHETMVALFAEANALRRIGRGAREVRQRTWLIRWPAQ